MSKIEILTKYELAIRLIAHKFLPLSWFYSSLLLWVSMVGKKKKARISFIHFCLFPSFFFFPSLLSSSQYGWKKKTLWSLIDFIGSSLPFAFFFFFFFVFFFLYTSKRYRSNCPFRTDKVVGKNKDLRKGNSIEYQQMNVHEKCDEREERQGEISFEYSTQLSKTDIR